MANGLLHIRFNRPDYILRFAEFDMGDTHACIIVCNDIVDEGALELTGVDYEPYKIEYWILYPTLTYVWMPIYIPAYSN